jgi:hypothetical protein
MSKKLYFNPRWDGARIPRKDWHFHRQLLRRYGIVLAPGEFSEIVHEIRAGYAKLIEKRSNRLAIYLVRIRRLNDRIFVLSDGRNLISAWPPEKRLIAMRRNLRYEPR